MMQPLSGFGPLQNIKKKVSNKMQLKFIDNSATKAKFSVTTTKFLATRTLFKKKN